MTASALILALGLSQTPAEAEACGHPPCDDTLLGSDDALVAAAPEFPLASAYLGTAGSCLTVYQVNEDGSTRPDCITCDVVVDLARVPGLGDGFSAIARGEIEARLERTVSSFRYAPEHAGRWGRTYYDFILEGDDTDRIPDRPEPARCPIPDIQTHTP